MDNILEKYIFMTQEIMSQNLLLLYLLLLLKLPN